MINTVMDCADGNTVLASTGSIAGLVRGFGRPGTGRNSKPVGKAVR
jgi:hypothetical protein